MINQTISHYTLIEMIGQGGMGTVYKAVDQNLDRTVAIKVLRPQLLQNPHDVIRFHREAQAAASLNHPNICTIYDFIQDDNNFYIIMEFIQGVTLKQYIKDHGPFSLQQAKKICSTAAQVLDVVHAKGIIHRDIKSDNIMIDKQGNIKIMDFGLAKIMNTPTLTTQDNPLGTVVYMSPEQITCKNVDHRTDLWSLGIVFYEMLTANLPFQNDSDVTTIYDILNKNPRDISVFDPRVNHSVKYIIHTLLEKKPDFRYQSAQELYMDLQAPPNRSLYRFILNVIRKNWKYYALTAILLIGLLGIYRTYLQEWLNRPAWLRSSAVPVRLTSLEGVEHGSLSPDRKRVVIHQGYNLYIKDLETRQSRIVYKVSDGAMRLPHWMPSGKQIYLSNLYINTVSVFDTLQKTMQHIYTENDGNIFHIACSPDGKQFIFHTETHAGQPEFTLNLINSDGTNMRELLREKYKNVYFLQTAWHPYHELLALFYYDYEKQEHSIRTLDLKNGLLSEPVIKLINQHYPWWKGGLTYTPDGKYLVYPDLIDGYEELLALPVKKNGTTPNGRPIQVTKLAGMGIPYFPEFDRKGEVLCYHLLIRNYDIYLAQIDLSNKTITNIKKMTNNTLYDYDASWSPDANKIVYVSNRDGQRDVFIHDLQNDQDTRITNTKSIEYMSQYIPNQPFVSFLTDSVIWKVPVNGGARQRVFPHDDSLKVFHYCWGKDENTLFALAAPEKTDGSTGHIYQYNVEKDITRRILSSINLPGYAEIRYSAVQNCLAIRGTDPDSLYNKNIELYYLDDNRRELVHVHSSITPNGELAWLSDGTGVLFSSYYTPSDFGTFIKKLNNSQPALFAMDSLKRYYCGQPAPDGSNRILLYTLSSESDIWMLEPPD